MRKLRILFLIAFILFAFCGVQWTFAEEEITLTFFNQGVEFTPNESNGVYSIEYSEDLNLQIKGGLAEYPNAESLLKIKQDGNVYVKTEGNALSNAGTYELMIEVKGDVVKSRTFTLVIEKKRVSNAYFDTDTLSIEYGEKIAPSLILPDGVYGNATVEYEFYNLNGEKLDSITSVGEYKVKGIINGKNYCGEIEDSFVINKANCYIEVENARVETNYKISNAGEQGYDLKEWLGVDIKGSDIDYPLSFKVKGNKDQAFYESRYINKVDSYLVEISFEGGSECFVNGSVSAVFILTKSDISFNISNYVTITYENDLDTVKAVRDEMYLSEYGYSVYGGGEKLGQYFSSASLNIAFFDDSSCDVEIEPPQNVRENCYYYKLSFVGNDYFNEAESIPSKLIIQRRDITKEISVKATNSYRNDEAYDILTTFSLPDIYDEEASLSYYKTTENGEGNLEMLEEKPSKPGYYICKVSIDSANYYASFNVSFSIGKIIIPEECLIVSKLEFTYGDKITIDAHLENYDIDNIVLDYYLKGAKLDGIPTNAGNYTVRFSVIDDNYQLDVEKPLTIGKKTLSVSINSLNVAYGEDIFVKKNGSYQEDYLVFDGLVNENDGIELKSLISLYVLLGDTELYEKSPLLVVGSYPVKARGEHMNYSITYQEGKINIEKRTLNISVGNIEQYYGYNISPQITVGNTAYSDSANDLATLFECYYTESSGREVTELAVGRYTIKVRLKSEYEGNSAVENYKFSYKNGNLTLLSNEKSDEEGNITIIGKFSSSENFVVRTDLSYGSFGKAIQKASGKVDITEFYYVPYALPTTDGSSFSLRLKSSSIAKDGVMLLVSYDGSEFIEQEFTVVNGQMELTLSTMPSYYAVCVPVKTNLPLIIGLIVGGVVVVAVVVTFIILWMSGAFVKAKKKDETKLSEGVIAPKDGRRSEDDELDEIIENFDYSTVKKEENPAERLARKEMEELREQYRLRLRRLRNMGDKSISDTMKEAGITDSSFDEEEAITRMIEIDEAKRKAEEEEKRKIEEEEKAKEEKEKTFVVNERKTGTLSGGGVAPKNTWRVDDDDF